LFYLLLRYFFFSLKKRDKQIAVSRVSGVSLAWRDTASGIILPQ
jgi:hypothetical protein